MLKQSWGVTDRASADEALNELLESAKRKQFLPGITARQSLIWILLSVNYYRKRALDKALEVAKEIQSTFESWDSFVQSYLEGYEAGSGDTSGDREEIYENLKACQWNPYSVSWNTKLKKNW